MLKFNFTIICITVIFLNKGFSDSSAKSGFLDFNGYYDSNKSSILTINTLVNFQNGFQYFSLLNIYNGTESDTLTDTDQYYTEQNLRWQFSSTIPVDLTLQWNLRSGKANDRLRLGARWRIHSTKGVDAFFKSLGISYSINFHLFQMDFQDEYIWQMEHVYRINIMQQQLDNRIYLAGFGDHTFGGSNDPAWVTEHQLGIRLVDHFYLITEFRRNEYRSSKKNSLAFGAEYVVRY